MVKIIDFSLNENELIIKPVFVGQTRLNIYDYCVLQSEINTSGPNSVINEEKVGIEVTDINSIHIESIDNKIEINKYLVLFLQINDMNGNKLKKSLFRLMNLKYKLNTNSSNLRLIDSDDDEFYLKMIKSTSNEQLNYEKIIKSSDEYTALYILHHQNQVYIII